MAHQMILTCRDCEKPNPRPLPYDMAAPDKCEHCSRPFRTWYDILKLDFQLWRKQSHLASAVEAVVNVGIGFVLAFGIQWLICWAYSIPISARDNVIIVSWMTGVSVLRSYAVRRLWNSEFWKRKPYIPSKLTDFEPCVERGDMYCSHTPGTECQTDKELYG